MSRKVLCGLLIDKTGSMNSIRGKTINGVNEYIGILKDNHGEATLIIATFNSYEGFKVARRGMAKGMEPITRSEYRPDHMTPLVDAMMEMLFMLEYEEDKLKYTGEEVLVIFATITDGYENHSKEHTTKELVTHIEQKRDAGWEIVFLGANIDSFSVARDYGISKGSTQNFSAEKISQTMRNLAVETVFAASDEDYEAGSFFKILTDADGIGGVNSDSGVA